MLQRDEFTHAVKHVLKSCGITFNEGWCATFVASEWQRYDADRSDSIDREEFGAWVVRFLDWCEPLHTATSVYLESEASQNTILCRSHALRRCVERRLLQDAGIDPEGSTCVVPPGCKDGVVEVAIRHCGKVRTFITSGAAISNQQIFSLANQNKEHLASVDLSSSSGFDTIGREAI